MDFHVKVFKTNLRRILFLNKSMISEILDLSWHDSVYPYDIHFIIPDDDLK